MGRAVRSAVLLAVLQLTAAPALANRESEALRARGAREIYSLAARRPAGRSGAHPLERDGDVRRRRTSAHVRGAGALVVQAGRGRSGDAEQDLRTAVSSEARKWVLGRAHLELGKLALKAGQPADRRRDLQLAATMGDADNDGATADEVRRLLK